jgi:hypothetical protein
MRPAMTTRPVRPVAVVALAAVALAAGLVTACGPTGGPVAGPPDTHCVGADGGAIVQVTSASACTPADPNPPAPHYGAPVYNAQAAEDDCKYDVQFTVDPIRERSDATFVVHLTSRVDGQPVAGAAARAEIFLSDTHPAPNTGTDTVEAPAGTYAIGPVQFDASGRWTVRFHFFETCADDTRQSPHGHVAFYLEVP